jgi:PAS domain S-box-containing protein
MNGKSSPPQPDAGEPNALPDPRKDPSEVKSPLDPSADGDASTADIQTLVTSFEERINSLLGHISELEARLGDSATASSPLTESAAEFSNLQDLGELTRATQDPLRVVEALERALRKRLGFDHLGIYLLDEGKKSIHALGPAPAELTLAAQNRHGEGIFDWVLAEQRPVIIPWPGEGDGEAHDRNLIIAPLGSGSQPLGAALLSLRCRPEEIAAQDLGLISYAVSLAAIGLGNTLRLNEALALQDFQLSMLENAADMIFALDPQGRFTFLNARVEELGYRQDELRGQFFQSLFRQTEVGDRIQNVLARGGKAGFDLEVRSRLTRHQRFFLSLTALKNSRGDRTGVLGVLRNITEAHHLQRKQLESERLAAYTQTVITLNHEINNPLTAVLGNLYLMEKEAHNSGNEKLLGRLKIIQENCLRIQKVIKKLERIEELKTVSYLGDTKMVDIGDVQD